MSFFISDAMAAAPQGQGDALTSLLPLVFIFIVFYFLLIRPQSKRQKEHKKMISELQKGEEVITTGGILGKITNINDDFVTLEIAKDVALHIQKNAVQAIMPKGTMKDQSN